MGNNYNNGFPWQLKNIIKEDVYVSIINNINETAQDYWPCCYCCMFGYILAPISCCMSLLCPRVCVNDAREAVDQLIEQYNKEKLNKLGLTMQLEFGCNMSWV